MAYDEGLAQRIRESSALPAGATEKRMFGGIAFMVNDFMTVGISDDKLMARVGPDNYERALKRPHATKMDFTGKPMRGYVFVNAPGIEDDDALAQWISDCVAFVRTLPPKKR